MGQRHDHISPPRPQAGQPCAGGSKNVAHADAVGKVITVPNLDLRGGKADHPDAQQVAATGLVGDPALEDRKRRHKGRVA